MKYILLHLSLLVFFSASAYSQSSPLPEKTRQLILVISDSADAVKGKLYLYEREPGKEWKSKTGEVPVVLGRKGMAWGKGLHSIDTLMLPVKVEGDGKTAAGVFYLGTAFGFLPEDEVTDLKIPYTYVSDKLECVDDVHSDYYNQLVNRNEVEEPDWKSSEKMAKADPWYRLGVVINQNMDPVVKGSGSCIFLHNWSLPDETSAGCTELEPSAMRELVYWLDSSCYPVIVQLTKDLYKYYSNNWGLPSVLSE